MALTSPVFDLMYYNNKGRMCIKWSVHADKTSNSP